MSRGERTLVTCSLNVARTLRHRWQRFERGDVVVVRHARLGCIIKRISDIEADGSLRLAGDHVQLSRATDVMGPVTPDRIIGKVIWHLPRRRASALVATPPASDRSLQRR